jgi:Xaa-Pro aminopeptidase
MTMETRRARLANVELPDFGTPDREPVLKPSIYTARLERLRERADERGYTHLLVYADREHSAGLAWLTGFDPRFEEAIAIVRPGARPLILAGNECYGAAGAAPLPMRRELYQDLSLPGQPREQSRILNAILADERMGPGARVGSIGWKSFADGSRIEIPAYVVDELRTLVGVSGFVENANDLLIDPADGLRTVAEIDQLASLEYAACQTSNGIRRLFAGLRPGMTEREAVRLLEWNGMPLSCHLMLTGGPRARFGLLSPSDRPIGRGDPFTVAFGVWGALNCRAGFVVEDASELPDRIADYIDRLVAPYFAAIAAWYGALHVGAVAGDAHAAAMSHLTDPFFGIFLNPGHLIGLDEWVNSPFFAGSRIELRSGMAFQVDVIPATGTDYFTTNIEDGIALADAALRDGLAAAYPDAWARIQARRRFMEESLGIELHEDVLPLSNLAAHLPPFLLRPDRAMTLAG